MTGQVLGIVPARLGSTRLPRKPLHLLLGRPLIEWVWRRVAAMKVLDHAVVATDSHEVVDVCHAIGAPVELTSEDHVSGTDRVAEVAGRPGYTGYGLVVNIQGDEPLIEEEHVGSAIELVRSGDWQVGTCATPVQAAGVLEDASMVKVARADSGRALYFSRTRIPWASEATKPIQRTGSFTFLRHLGIYAYEQSALEQWASLAPSRLEQIESLEQLRPLEADLRIGVAIVEGAHEGVDTLLDAARVEQQLSHLTHSTLV
ncbi:MAG TPA: 3-deoxy-manno-octulosonate cytidylyltransferase [Gemmatimonadetes bacterium]|jgi:3-deoxy-manno-octulosonate cytidylyltransferase (CMP-KDO synthetase)|nr:3-deoxy-manno-octulosonate cytidylyltransferase [Gemmatimonadota bacterium]